MGLVVDLAESRIDVLDNPAPPAMYAVGNELVCKFANFQSKFAFRFEAPKKGAVAQTKTESWRIGVIQNVLFEKNRFKWEDGTEHHVTWEKPVVDSGSEWAFPFYQDNPEASQRADPLVQNPYRDIYLGAQGFGELLDPWAKAPNDVVTKSGWSVTSADRPQFGCPLRTRGGALLVHAEQVVTFGVWLVAIADEGQRAAKVLAHAPPFTMVYSTTLNSGKGMLTLEIPDAPFYSYAMKGFLRSANPALRAVNAPGLSIAAGPGSRSPTLKGQTANMRERSWAVGTILAV